MLSMILYAFGIMYTPGPINLLGMNLGVNKKFKHSIGYFAGVGTAMFTLFLLYGYTGERIIKKEYLFYISIIGSAYILYLAYKLFKSNTKAKTDGDVKLLTFREGLFMQLMNPKATLATLPIATIHFPANGITGIEILFVSFFLAIMAGGAPATYSFLGEKFSGGIRRERVLKVFNMGMAILLAYVAVSIFWDHVYLVLQGVKEY